MLFFPYMFQRGGGLVQTGAERGANYQKSFWAGSVVGMSHCEFFILCFEENSLWTFGDYAVN